MSLCGTYTGWNHHKKHKETVCQPCQDAATAYMRSWRFRTGRYHDPTRCTECGSVFLTEHRCTMENREI